MAATFSVAGYLQRAPEKLLHITGSASIVEYQVDEEGNYHWRAYEWLAPERET